MPVYRMPFGRSLRIAAFPAAVRRGVPVTRRPAANGVGRK